MYYITTATERIFRLTKRIKAIQGGTSAGKTIGTLQVIIDRCQTVDKDGDVTSIVSETLPHLKKGAIRDFLSIMQNSGYFQDSRWNKTNFTYTFETGAIIEFFGADQPAKVRGPRRKRLFINEANNVPYEVFDQLEIRTADEIFIDWNPTNEFWFDSELKYRDDVEHIILTYKDNEQLADTIIRSIEQHKDNKNWWQVYGLGMLGQMEHKIYDGWRIIDAAPHEARLVKYGLDFGYSQDPAALVAIYYLNGGYILDEVLYQVGLSNKQIADVLKGLDPAPIIADSAEPKSIDEMRLYGLSILPALKGKGSITHGIRYLQSQRISVTKSSVNLIKEYRNYTWKKDRNGVITDVPIDIWNHGLDAVRYAIGSELPKTQRKTYVQPAYESPSIDVPERRVVTVQRRVIPMRPYESSGL